MLGIVVIWQCSFWANIQAAVFTAGRPDNLLTIEAFIENLYRCLIYVKYMHDLVLISFRFSPSYRRTSRDQTQGLVGLYIGCPRFFLSFGGLACVQQATF